MTNSFPPLSHSCVTLNIMLLFSENVQKPARYKRQKLPTQSKHISIFFKPCVDISPAAHFIGKLLILLMIHTPNQNQPTSIYDQSNKLINFHKHNQTSKNPISLFFLSSTHVFLHDIITNTQAVTLDS